MNRQVRSASADLLVVRHEHDVHRQCLAAEWRSGRGGPHVNPSIAIQTLSDLLFFCSS